MKYSATILTVLMFTSAYVHAEMLVGTPEDAPFSGRVAIGEYGFGGNYPVMQAKPFTTGLTAYTLTSIFVGTNLTHSGGTGDFSVSVHSNNGSLPGAPVAGGQNLFVADPTGIHQMMNAGAVVELAPNSTYWFVASAAQSGGDTRYWWNMTDSALVDVGVPGFGMPLTSANDVNGWVSYPGASMQMQVYGQSVPEPASISLIGIGGMGVWMARKKRLKRIRRKQGPEFDEPVYELTFLNEERAHRSVG